MDLRKACKTNDLTIVKYLVGHNYYHKNDLVLALNDAAKNGHLNIVEYFINHHKNTVNDPFDVLCTATKCNHLHIVEFLFTEIRYIAEQYRKKYWELAVTYANLPIIEFLVKKGFKVQRDFNIAINCFAARGDLNCIRFLHSNGAEITQIAVENAVKNDHLKVVKYFINANVVLMQKVYLLLKFTGTTGNINMLDELVNYSTNPYILQIVADNIIFRCIKNHHIHMIEHLANKGIDITNPNPNNSIPFMHGIYAITLNSLDMVKYLHETHNIFRNNPKRAVVVSIQNGNLHILKYLLEQGFKYKVDSLHLIKALKKIENFAVVSYVLSYYTKQELSMLPQNIKYFYNRMVVKHNILVEIFVSKRSEFEHMDLNLIGVLTEYLGWYFSNQN